MAKSILNRIQTIAQSNDLENPNECAAILSAIIDENHDIDSMDDDEILSALQTMDGDLEDDFSFEFDCNEYRVIVDGAIWGIYVETIKEIVNECYDLKLDKIPDFIALSVDWEQTAQNAFVDGYGHTFATYDGEEIEVFSHGSMGDLIYYVFRTN